MKTVKRITRILTDKKSTKLNNLPNFKSHEFLVEGEPDWDCKGVKLWLTDYDSNELPLWEKLGKPSRIRVTITVIEDE